MNLEGRRGMTRTERGADRRKERRVEKREVACALCVLH